MKYEKVWKFGNNINTDIISPPAYLELTVEDAKKYTMAPADPGFASNYKPGEIVVAEHNMGSGSSRETAPLMLKALGVRFVVAMDFARIFYRNCINVGILPVECKQTDRISAGDFINVDYVNGKISNGTNGEVYECSKIPSHIMDIAECGGLIEYIKQKRLNTTN